MKKLALIIGLIFLASSASAEFARYGQIKLNGLAKNSWNPGYPGLSNAMVCNVNGPDGFLSIRECASTSCRDKRKLLRLAIVQVDTSQRQGSWVQVQTAWRTHTKNGQPLVNEKKPTCGRMGTHKLPLLVFRKPPSEPGKGVLRNNNRRWRKG